MGYNLTIGEAAFEVDKVGDNSYTETLDDEFIRVVAKPVKLDNAPAAGEPTDYTNERWPSYTQWHDFAKKVGLMDVLFQYNEVRGYYDIRGGHSGFFAITPAFKAEIDKAVKNWLKKYPDAKPEYVEEYTGGDSRFPEYVERHAMMVRLHWLQFWTDWALENCECPIFVNT
jgi:hypothetical protein